MRRVARPGIVDVLAPLVALALGIAGCTLERRAPATDSGQAAPAAGRALAAPDSGSRSGTPGANRDSSAGRPSSAQAPDSGTRARAATPRSAPPAAPAGARPRDSILGHDRDLRIASPRDSAHQLPAVPPPEKR